MRARVDRRTVGEYQDMARAATQNEKVTRDRVGALERSLEGEVRELESIRGSFSVFVHLGFWGRLRWLVLGR